MMLDDFELPRDIGFHYFEIGNPQRLLVTIEVWLDEASFAVSDHVERAWNYDFLRSTVIDLVHGRRFNLQETLVREIYGIVAARTIDRASCREVVCRYGSISGVHVSSK